MPITKKNQPDITKNIRIIEWIKAELIGSISLVFKAMIKGSEEKIIDALSSIVIMAYILGKRLGINFSQLDVNIESKLKQGIEAEHEVEKWYGDFSSLLNHRIK